MLYRLSIYSTADLVPRESACEPDHIKLLGKYMRYLHDGAGRGSV